MRERVEFRSGDLCPAIEAVVQQMGIAAVGDLAARHRKMLDAAFEAYEQLAEPVALVETVPREAFAIVFEGDGLNDHESPLGGIYPRADGLALFAATLGEPVSAEISRLFADNDSVGGFVLDAIASAAADRLSDRLAERMAERFPGGTAVLPYSPGYCGWHITAQRALFSRLRPGEIGMRLNDSCLMHPLKSVSGVLVAGAGAVHRFKPEFDFCDACATRQCVRRMASVRAAARAPGASRARSAEAGAHGGDEDGRPEADRREP